MNNNDNWKNIISKLESGSWGWSWGGVELGGGIGGVGVVGVVVGSKLP